MDGKEFGEEKLDNREEVAKEAVNEETDKNKIEITELKRYMKTKEFGQQIIYYEEVDSTNTVAKNIGKNTGNHGTLIIANTQTAGKGRLGRVWNSPKNEGIWMSLILKPTTIEMKNISMLTLVAALAVNDAIKKITGIKSYIKWPNDIVINGKKVCGILTEMSTMGSHLECIIIGIGINVFNESFSPELMDKATSLLSEGSTEINKYELISNIMLRMEDYYSNFIKTQNLEELVNEYNHSLINLNQVVRILDNEKSYMGIALGIDKMGHLLVETEKEVNKTKVKVIESVMSGEVSVRGVYGYV